MVAGAAAASRAPADAVTPTSASRRVKVFPMGAVIADGPIRCCGKTRLSGPSLVASYRQILCDQAGAVSHKAVSGPRGRLLVPWAVIASYRLGPVADRAARTAGGVGKEPIGIGALNIAKGCALDWRLASSK